MFTGKTQDTCKFLYAAERMGVEPTKCAVVEDTAIGVRAGIAAGMTVFGYAKLTPAHKLENEGAITFDDMRRLPSLLKETPSLGASRPAIQ